MLCKVVHSSQLLRCLHSSSEHVAQYVHHLKAHLGNSSTELTCSLAKQTLALEAFIVFTRHHCFLQMNYQYKQLIGAMIVAGWDRKHGGQVYGCPIGGTLVQESWTTDGSGSTFIWGHLDAEFRQAVMRQSAPLACAMYIIALCSIPPSFDFKPHTAICLPSCSWAL